MACVGLRQGVWSYLNLESILLYPFYIRLKKKKKNWAHKESVTYQGHKLANACLRFLTLKVKSLSRVRLFVTPWTVAYQSSLSMGFSRQEYWSGLPFPSPGDLPDLGNKLVSPALQVDSLPVNHQGSPTWQIVGIKYILILFLSPQSFKDKRLVNVKILYRLAKGEESWIVVHCCCCC